MYTLSKSRVVSGYYFCRANSFSNKFQEHYLLSSLVDVALFSEFTMSLIVYVLTMAIFCNPAGMEIKFANMFTCMVRVFWVT